MTSMIYCIDLVHAVENAIVIDVAPFQSVGVNQLGSIVEDLHIIERHMNDIGVLLDLSFDPADRVFIFAIEEANVPLGLRRPHLDVQSVNVWLGVYVGNDHPMFVLDFFKLKLLRPAIAIQMCL